MPVLYFRILACLLISGVSTTKAPADEPLYVAKPFTAEGSFTPGVEGPAVDRDGNVQLITSNNHYAFNLAWLKQLPPAP